MTTAYAPAYTPARPTLVWDLIPAPVPLPWVVRLLLLYLGSITIFGKGPTYLIYPPLFWGELVMLAALIWLVDRHGLMTAFVPYVDLLTGSVIAFFLTGLAITVMWFPVFGLEAVRDAALWYYASFFFVGAQIAKDTVLGDRIFRILRQCWIAGIFWAIADELSGLTFSRIGPVLPWRGEPLFSNSHYEIVQHMGLSSLILLNPILSGDILGRWRPLFVPVGALGLFLAFASHGRGVRVGLLLSVIAMIVLYLAPGPSLIVTRRLLSAVLAAVLVFLCVTIVFSADDQKAVAKLARLDRFGEATDSTSHGTAYWRYIWWERLFAEVLTENPALGLGFGQSLNVYNPYLKGNEKTAWPTRSPHNVNITIFSRMGILGAALWILVLFFGLGGLWLRVWRGMGRVRSYYSAKRREELAFWIMMLVTTWVNSSFGVLMEGPVLGVWFWFALGFAWTRSLVDAPVWAGSASGQNMVCRGD